MKHGALGLKQIYLPKYGSLLIENEIFDLETFSECIDLEPDFLSAKINVKNIALQNSIKVRLNHLLNFYSIVASLTGATIFSFHSEISAIR